MSRTQTERNADMSEDKDLMPKVIGGIGKRKSNGGSQFYQQDRIYDSSKVATSLSAKLPGGGEYV